MTSIDRQLVNAVSTVPTVSIDGRFYRCVSQSRIRQALDGSDRGGRWGSPGSFRVLYLTDEYESCVIEAYRHANDAALDPVGQPVNLGLITVDVKVSNVVDLRGPHAQMLGLDASILFSEPQLSSGAAYESCSRVASVAHQLRRHGVIAPAATGRGLTLALFADLLPDHERPQLTGGVSQWERLPADPRRLRLVIEEPGGA
jgi:hypothetical protein